MTMQQNNNATNAAHAQALARIHADPLSLVPDMPGSWFKFGREGVPFDKGVQPLLDAHQRDGGGITDIEVPDIRVLPIGPSPEGVTLSVGRVSTGECFKLRRTAWSGLASRLRLGEGATDMILNRMPPDLQVATLNTMMRREREKIPATLRVRNGEILRLGNMSHGWARVIIDLAVPYDSDVDAIQDRILEVAVELSEDKNWRYRIIEKPSLWGIESISAEAIVVRVVVKTRSTAKDDVARELRYRLKKALDDMGVKLPSLNSVMLSGFAGAAGLRSTKAQRPKPKPLIDPALQNRPNQKKPATKPVPTQTSSDKDDA